MAMYFNITSIPKGNRLVKRERWWFGADCFNRVLREKGVLGDEDYMDYCDVYVIGLDDLKVATEYLKKICDKLPKDDELNASFLEARQIIWTRNKYIPMFEKIIEDNGFRYDHWYALTWE